MNDMRMHPDRLEELRVMLVDKKMTSRAIQRLGIHPTTIVRAKRLLGIPTQKDIRNAQALEAERARAESREPPPAGVPISELSIGRCVWMVSQSPRLFCGKPEEPECKPYCVKCNSLAMQQRQQARLTLVSTKSAKRSR